MASVRDDEQRPADRPRLVRATVCFASVAGFTALSEALGVERAYGIVTGGLRVLEGIARRHGAAVDKYLGDSLMAVYGHPVPLPCPAAAAVTAALEMQRRLREYDAELALPVRLELQVGIATGPLVAGVVGDQVVREFHVLGDTVNVAARLRAKAPRNGVRVDETTAAESVDECTFGPPLSLVLKGKARPVLARDARGLCSRRTERSLVGANVLRTPLV